MKAGKEKQEAPCESFSLFLHYVRVGVRDVLVNEGKGSHNSAMQCVRQYVCVRYQHESDNETYNGYTIFYFVCCNLIACYPISFRLFSFPRIFVISRSFRLTNT